MASKSEKLIWIIGIVFTVIFLIVLVLVKLSVPSFTLGPFIFSILGVLLFFGLIIGVYHFISKRIASPVEAPNKKLAPAVTLEQAREIAIKCTQNAAYADYITGCLGEEVEELGKTGSLVYTYKGKGKYEKDIYYVVLNMHAPEKRMSILFNPSENKLLNAKLKAADNPVIEVGKKITTVSNPISGTQVITEEPGVADKDKEKEAKDKDL